VGKAAEAMKFRISLTFSAGKSNVHTAPKSWIPRWSNTCLRHHQVQQEQFVHVSFDGHITRCGWDGRFWQRKLAYNDTGSVQLKIHVIPKLMDHHMRCTANQYKRYCSFRTFWTRVKLIWTICVRHAVMYYEKNIEMVTKYHWEKHKEVG